MASWVGIIWIASKGAVLKRAHPSSADKVFLAKTGPSRASRREIVERAVDQQIECAVRAQYADVDGVADLPRTHGASSSDADRHQRLVKRASRRGCAQAYGLGRFGTTALMPRLALLTALRR
jgi:hypothetical protein